MKRERPNIVWIVIKANKIKMKKHLIDQADLDRKIVHDKPVISCRDYRYTAYIRSPPSVALHFRCRSDSLV